MAQDHSYQHHFPEPANLPEVNGRVSSSGQHPTGQEFDSSGWQTVDFPNTLSVQNLSRQNTSVQDVAGAGSNPTSKLMNNSVSENGHGMLSSEREIELLTLIRDLNECNDVLLQKVSELEEALDRSQTALQAEIDHSQQGGHPTPSSVTETQAGRPTDRQIAKLVTELELSNQALQRQQLLSETLQAELAMSQEKVTQLEHECTRLQQQQTDQAQSLLQAESNCRDLRARLHRQQRYTLQFKAALEKCLNVSADHQTQTNNFISVTDVHSAASSVAMPKAQNIQPWASEGLYQKLDPQLESMIRNTKPAATHPDRTTQQLGPAKLQPAASPKPADPAAEDQLWQDLARVIETPVTPTADTASDLLNTDFETADTFETSPWHTPLPAPQRQVQAPTALPSESQPEISLEVLNPSQPKGLNASQDAYVPALNVQEGAPSPRVAPLKPQRKIKSLAAVELPSFPRLPKPAQ